MLRGTVTTKIRFLVNLVETKLNPPQTYTIHTNMFVNIPNFLLPPDTPIFLMGFPSAPNAADLVGFSDIENLLLGYRVEQCW